MKITLKYPEKIHEKQLRFYLQELDGEVWLMYDTNNSNDLAQCVLKINKDGELVRKGNLRPGDLPLNSVRQILETYETF